MVRKKLCIVIFLPLLSVLIVSCGPKKEPLRSGLLDYPAYLSEEEKKALSSWLDKHTELRLAIDSDCECEDMIEQMNEWTSHHGYKEITYHPYYVAGDFNGDGRRDFAVVLVHLGEKVGRYEIAIFNGTANPGKVNGPAYLLKGLDLEHQGLFYGPPRPQPWVLMFGPFETELDFGFVPKGDTYEYMELPSK